MADTWGLITTRQTAMQPFYDQVDKARKRLNLKAYKLMDFDGKTPLDNVISITENKSATYVSRIIAGLMSSKWQAVVEGEISKRDAHKIELFIEDNLAQADEYMLDEYGLAGLDTWLCNHVCHTSLIGVEFMSRIEDGEYKVHCLPLDMRHTPFVQNKCASPITWRSKEDLEQELEGFAKEEGGKYTSPGTLKDTDNEVRDYWDSDKRELWIESKLVFSQPNTYSKLPFVFVWPPSGFMFRDKGYLEHESPGLLYLNEGLYDQLSRQLSIDATMGFHPVRPAYQRPVKNPDATKPSMEPPAGGVNQDVAEGELFELLPRPDINLAQRQSIGEVNRMVDEAAPMSPSAYTQPPPAVTIAAEEELKDQLHSPQVIGIQILKAQLARLIIDQAMLLGGKDSIAVGKRGKRQNFTVADLKDPDKYSISYLRTGQNKRMMIVNQALALAAWGKAPVEYILKDIWQVEDPDGWMKAMALEKGKAIEPALDLVEVGFRYAEEAEDMEDGAEKDLKNWQSIMIAHKYAMLMQQPVAPNETQNIREATKETGNANAMISMLGPGQGQGAPTMSKEVTVP